MRTHLANHIENPGLRSDSTLHVIGVISNPVRYHSRYRLARDWIEAIQKTQNVRVYMVEAVFGDRHFEVTSTANEDHLQLYTNSEIWIKENMINLGVRRLLPRNWQYMAWVDCDVFFDNKNWALETLHELQRNPVVQPWANALDLDHYGNVYQTFQSFGAAWELGGGKLDAKNNGSGKQGPYYSGYAHSGFAWACRRDFFEAVEKLIDFCIIGSGDHHMAWAMVNQVDSAIHPKANESYRRMCREWQFKVTRFLNGRIGYVPGFLKHMHHGPKKRRQYWGRWEIQLAHDYNPYTDITYDPQGLIQLRSNPKMEQEIQRYNRQRIEDSIESY